MTYHCATCWQDLDPDWPGGICQTCQDAFTDENTQLQEGHP